jgi:hypothetical protein
MNGEAPMGSACKMQYFNHVNRNTHVVTGKVCPAIY